MTRLRFDNVSASYGRGEVLCGVTCSLHAGAITAIVGPNGSGKTTLFRTVVAPRGAGVRRTGGAVLLDGEPVEQLATRRRVARIAYIPQRPSVAGAFTVQAIVELGRYALRDNAQAVRQAVRRAGLLGMERLIYGELSVGEQQRVTLARALTQIHGGEADAVVLADEPTSAMDIRHEVSAMAVFRELSQAGVAVGLVVHDLQRARRWADRAVLLDAGRVVAEGEADDILTPQRLGPVFGVHFVDDSLAEPVADAQT
ncbi:MAG: ABC transporter ATP-binding protein [Phycisphaerales bacterium]|nr:ABC transporter ATP-binding protein [Phycisphaerales bacterium]